MILNITTTYAPATDWGYVLHKHPDKLQTVELSMGEAHIFYPQKSETSLTLSLLLDIDPIEMVRGNKKSGSDNFALAHYVNDRPYVASSFMSVAIAKAFASALNGKCKERPELVAQEMPFEVMIASVAAPKGGESLIRRLFEPLGYEVRVERQVLDDKFPEWGASKYYILHLKNKITTQALLSHLYVLLPTLDNDKHYFVNQHEIEKLLQKGEGWLKNHPEKEQITKRYLINLTSLSRQALERLSEGELLEAEPNEWGLLSETEKRKESLHEKRLQKVAEVLLASGANTVLDLGCGEGKLLRKLLKHKQFTQIAGVDVSYQELLKAKEKLHYDEMSPKQKERITLFQGSLMYQDERLKGFEAAAVVEVIEHLEPNRLAAFERVLFENAKPQTIVLTTPNREYNVTWESLEAGIFRHSDHRFEWNRAEFASWAKGVAQRYGYRVEIAPLGEELENIGAPSQMAIFTHGN
ncbi:3' terminal RNA ribose 2'-O-methyltransferase Hen1 [Hugenholtzia roseola]|uniref:3' terminal RNA ribose 2'-O-methyltransferase Hen1 n=1 Tax=Hugenholtzia roseola TaxID=1002 RepID=UPI000409ED71|nr:3' terminal RNA ribose 2'-O-methyltransferase Hen1 [Hugenholtzia roseola]